MPTSHTVLGLTCQAARRCASAGCHLEGLGCSATAAAAPGTPTSWLALPAAATELFSFGLWRHVDAHACLHVSDCGKCSYGRILACINPESEELPAPVWRAPQAAATAASPIKCMSKSRRHALHVQRAFTSAGCASAYDEVLILLCCCRPGYSLLADQQSQGEASNIMCPSAI